MELPEISPWDFKWNSPEGPETAGMGDTNYLMNAAQVLDLALHNEIRGRDFYAEVAADSPDPEVRRIAAEMVDEENEHVELLKVWIEREGSDKTPPQEDLDPPNMPE
jgi:rubrerythrin